MGNFLSSSSDEATTHQLKGWVCVSETGVVGREGEGGELFLFCIWTIRIGVSDIESNSKSSKSEGEKDYLRLVGSVHPCSSQDPPIETQ